MVDNEKGTLTSFFSKRQPPPQMDSNIKRDENPQDDEVIITDGDQPALAEPMEHTPHVEKPNVALDAASNAIQASKQPSNNNSKKRKGRPSILDTVTEEQAAALEVFYSSHSKRGSINNTKKAELASRVGLDTSNITTWIEHRRKKAKAEAIASPNVPIQQQQQQLQQPAAPPPPPPTAGANNNIHILLEPNTEVKRTMEDVGGPVITPAPALSAPHTISRQQIPEQLPQLPQQQQQQPVNPPPAPAPPATTTVELPAGFPTSMDQIEQFKADFCTEIANLKTKGLSPPLIFLDADACLPVQPFTDVLLAKHVVGQRMPRSALIATLHPLFTIAVQTNTSSDAAGIDGGQQEQQASAIINTAVPEDLLLARLLDIATRRSYAPKSSNNKGGKSGGIAGGNGSASSSFFAPLTKDPLDDDSPEMLWQWELRDVKLLSNKDTRSKAVAIKKRAAKVQERLGALQFALEVFGEYKPLLSDKIAGKAVRAFTNLAKMASFESMENEMKNEKSVVVAKQQETEEAARQRALLKAEKEAEKERLRVEKEAEREKLKAEKEAEKERLRVEKEAEKEKLKAEKEQSKQQKNAQKVVKQTGFKDTKQLERSKNKFMQFFGKAPQAGAATTTTTNTTDNKNNNTSQGQDEQQQQQQEQPASPQSQGAGSASRSRLPKKERTYQDLFLKPTPDTVFPQPTFSSLVDTMDSALFGSMSTDMAVDLTNGQQQEEEQQKKREMTEVVTEESTVLQDWQSIVHQWKQNKRTAAQHKATFIPLGLPPAWSRIPGPEGLQLASAAVNQHLDFGFDHATIRTYRRKFLWFESDSKRPPFYGSFSNINRDIRPRHYWGRDDELDYEVMSDLDWEEEPDGSSLSEADSDEEDNEEAGLFGIGGGAAGELEDSEFIKPDGYLSEDEGVGLEEGDDDDDAACSGDVVMMMGDDNEAGTLTGLNMDTVAGMRQKKRLGLEMQMERARKCHKPLFISRLPATTTILPPISEQQQAQGQNTSFIQGDVNLLEGICWEVLVPGAVIEMPPDPAQVAASAAAAVAAQAQANIAAAAKLLNDSSLPVGTVAITGIDANGNDASAAAGIVGEIVVGVGVGGGPTVTNTKPKIERPEELVPSLLSILQSNPKRGGDKIIEEFIAAHQGRKIVKKWAQTRLKEHAAYVKNQWQLNEKGLALLGLSSSGGGGGTRGSSIALQQQQQPATAGPLLTAFLKSAPPNTATPTATPTPTPIKNDATNVGMGDHVPLSSWKNYWQHIVRCIEHSSTGHGIDKEEKEEEKECDIDRRVASAFAPREKLVGIIGDIPAFVVSALVVSLLQHPRGVVAEGLSSIVDVLVGDGGGLNNNNNNNNNTAAATTMTTTTAVAAPSQQQVFAQRTGPARVSLSGLCGEPLLMDALVHCLDVDACRQPALMMVKKLMLLEEVRNGEGGVGQLRKVVEKVQKQQSMMVSQWGGENDGEMRNTSGLHLGAAMSLATEVVDLAGSFGILSSSP